MVSPGPHRPRATGIRRPRVAGRVPARPKGPATPAAAVTVSAPADRAQDDRLQDDRAQDTAVAVAEQRPQPTGKRQLRRRGVSYRVAGPATATRRARRAIPVPVLAVALALAVGLAVFFGVADARLRGTPAAQNTALVDIATTAQVSRQVDDALKTIYSFDYARLDQNEAAARAVITPGFAAQFNELFTQVRRLAPQQQAVVRATVNVSAVKSINGDTAVLLVFLDQQATRAQSGSGPQQLAAAGRLTVTAQQVNGIWKVADVQPR